MEIISIILQLLGITYAIAIIWLWTLTFAIWADPGYLVVIYRTCYWVFTGEDAS